MAYSTAGGMNPDFSEFEEILNMQTQGRRLSDMQLHSLNQFVQRRCSNAGGPMNMSGVQMPSQYPPMGQMGPPMGQMGQHQMMNDSYLSAAQHYQNNLSNYGNDRNWIESNNPDSLMTLCTDDSKVQVPDNASAIQSANDIMIVDKPIRSNSPSIVPQVDELKCMMIDKFCHVERNLDTFRTKQSVVEIAKILAKYHEYSKCFQL